MTSARDAVAAEAPSRAPESRGSAVLVSLPIASSGATIEALDRCACCGAAVSRALEARRSDGTRLRYGACNTCLEHAAAFTTERFAIAAACLVLGVGAAVTLPLLLRWHGLAPLASIALVLAAAPLVVWTWRSRIAPASGHGARGAPFRFERRGELYCATAALADLVAPEEAPRRAIRARELGPSFGGFALTAAFVLGALVPAFSLSHGDVRVLNLGEAPIRVEVDGRELGRVEPTSGESPRAGHDWTLPAGRRHVRVLALPEGTQLLEREITVVGGEDHLFAPANDGYCFRLERRGYGNAEAEPSVEPLPPGDFWVMPPGTLWFEPDPPSGALAASGGVLITLRQSRCRAELPPLEAP